jgi:hypothetical protein
MAKHLGGIVALAMAFCSGPAWAEGRWSAFDQGRAYDDRPYLYFVPTEFGRSGRFISWDDGYFALGGGVEVRNNRASYDYDRDYPYEYRSHGVSAEEQEEEQAELAGQRCTLERVRDAKTRGTTEVRICRN